MTDAATVEVVDKRPHKWEKSLRVQIDKTRTDDCCCIFCKEINYVAQKSISKTQLLNFIFSAVFSEENEFFFFHSLGYWVCQKKVEKEVSEWLWPKKVKLQ